MFLIKTWGWYCVLKVLDDLVLDEKFRMNTSGADVFIPGIDRSSWWSILSSKRYSTTRSDMEKGEDGGDKGLNWVCSTPTPISYPFFNATV